MTESVDFKRIDQIGDRSRDLVSGYLRENEQELFSFAQGNPYYHISPLITRLCLLFWFPASADEFDYALRGKTTVLSSKHQVRCTSSVGWGNAYGKLSIPSMVDQTVSWSLKVVGPTANLCVGVHNAEGKYRDESGHTCSDKAHYLIYTKDGTLYDWNGRGNRTRASLGKTIEPGAVVKITLKLNKEDSSMTYQVNQLQPFIASTEIAREKELSYRLMIQMGTKDNSVEIIECLHHM